MVGDRRIRAFLTRAGRHWALRPEDWPDVVVLGTTVERAQAHLVEVMKVRLERAAWFKPSASDEEPA
jgi:hypothetical protein